MTDRWLAPLPLVAILRGIQPREAVAVGAAIVAAGFHLLEVPFNSPQPVTSIRALVDALGDTTLVGAGTVMTADQVHQVADAGGRLIVMPHADTAVIGAAHDAGLIVTPGVATLTEAFAALAAGATGLKLFPANQFVPATLKAWRAVLPRAVTVLPVGGIDVDSMAPWITAGANGFGIGSALYKPGMTADEAGRAARAFKQAWDTAAQATARNEEQQQ